MRLYTKPFTVTPYAGVWIEIDKYHEDIVSFQVTPYAGVWIEIQKINDGKNWRGSLPTRECGLKYLPCRF